MTHIRLPTPIASLKRHQVQQIKFAVGLKAYSGAWKSVNVLVFRLRNGRPRNLDAILRYRKVNFVVCRSPVFLWSPHNHHIQRLPADNSSMGVKDKADIGVKLIIHSHIVSMFGVSGVLTPLPQMPSWPAQGQQSLNLPSCLHRNFNLITRCRRECC